MGRKEYTREIRDMCRHMYEGGMKIPDIARELDNDPATKTIENWKIRENWKKPGLPCKLSDVLEDFTPIRPVDLERDGIKNTVTPIFEKALENLSKIINEENLTSSFSPIKDYNSTIKTLGEVLKIDKKVDKESSKPISMVNVFNMAREAEEKADIIEGKIDE